MVHFGVTDGRLWIFALLRRDQDTGGWTTLVYPLQDIQHISFSKRGEHTLQLPLIMDILLHWVGARGRFFRFLTLSRSMDQATRSTKANQV